METPETAPALQQRHEQMLKLVAKGFYGELIKYGVHPPEIVTVAGHLLDNVLHQSGHPDRKAEYYDRDFRIEDIRDRWAEARRLAIGEVGIRPFDPALVPLVASWLTDAVVRESFVPAFPAAERELAAYLARPASSFFGIYVGDEPTGIIGAENMDRSVSKLEMRKLVGNTAMRGKGVGKRATFLFLYYVFEILGFHKVFLHSTDVNIRNLNLNTKFGFELEGVFPEEALVGGQMVDVVRMGLRAAVWQELFAPGGRADGRRAPAG